MASSDPLGFIFPDTAQDATEKYGASAWNIPMEGWTSLSSLLTSPVSAERSTTSTGDEQDTLPQFTCQLPILPAAKALSPMHGDSPLDDSANVADTGTGRPKYKRKIAKPSETTVIAVPPATSAPTTTKPKAKPKARPLNKSSVVAEIGTNANEGQGCPMPAANGSMQQPQGSLTELASTSARSSKRIPVKSRRNEIADAIGSDGMTFVGIGKENPLHSQDSVGGLKRTAMTQERAIPSKYVGDIPVFRHLANSNRKRRMNA